MTGPLNGINPFMNQQVYGASAVGKGYPAVETGGMQGPAPKTSQAGGDPYAKYDMFKAPDHSGSGVGDKFDSNKWLMGQ